MKVRLNSITGQTEVELKPKDLPPIWVPYGVENLCNRCKPFKICLEFDKLSSNNWNQLDKLIKEINNYKGDMFDVCLKENSKQQ